MTSNVIFIDTSFFKAIVDINDNFHQKALQCWENVKQKKYSCITSNYILDETFTVVRSKCSKLISFKVRGFIAVAKPAIVIKRVAPVDEGKAWGWFEKDWSHLSFTDCVTFAQMKRLGVTKIATFDNHFTKAGFEIVK